MSKKLILLSFFFTLLLSTTTFAEIVIKDEAGILTPEERQNILNSYTTEELTFIYTTTEMFSDDSPIPHNTMLQLAQGRPVVMFYINMGTRFATIDDDNAYVWGSKYYDKVWDKVQPYLSQGNNYDACTTFLNDVEKFEANKFDAELLDYKIMWSRFIIVYLIVLLILVIGTCWKAVKKTKGLEPPKAKDFIDRSKTSVVLANVNLISKQTFRHDTTKSSSGGHRSGGSHGHGHSRGGHF